MLIAEPFTAIDFGTHLLASEDGVPDNSYKIREPGKRFGTTRFCSDFVAALRLQFEAGRSVVTESATLGSFRMRYREDEIVDLLVKFPDLHLYTLGTHATRNQLAREGLIVKGGGGIDNALAAATQHRIASLHGAKVWQPRDWSLAVTRVDPLRPHYHELVRLRNDGYPKPAMMEQVYRFLPTFADLTDDQKIVLGDGRKHYADDRAAALVISLKEPASSSREGWDRVVGASSHGRGSIYRQILIVGKPRSNYRHREHLTGMMLSDARKAYRSLRAPILVALAAE